MTLDQATTNSVNTVYAQLAAEVGPENIADVLDDFEFDRPGTEAERDLHGPSLEVCSLALGTLDVSPLEMARAYAGFAGRGALPDVMPIRYIEDSDGDCLREYRQQRDVECEEDDLAQTERVVEANSVDVLNQSLQHVVSGGTAVAANLADGRPVAGKTGTTQNHANAWFAGHVPQLATVVWMGYPIERRRVPCTGTEAAGECKKGMKLESYVPLMESCSDLELCRPVVGDLGYAIEVTGGSFPARIWSTFMSVAVEDMEVLPFPIPTDSPDEVIHAAPTGSPKPSPSRSKRARESPGPTAAPTETSQPSPQPTNSNPNPLPTQSGGNDDGG